MSREIILALDAMGGDHAPGVVLKGANIARERHPGVHFKFYGQEDKINSLLNTMPKLKAVSSVVHCDEYIPGDMKPSLAVRQSKKSSMRVAIEAVKAGEAHCIVSAGNTGALMALSKMILGMMKGVDRPAIASYLPTERGESIMLDLGANVECDADNLVQFAVLGEVFARSIFGIVRPSVALLNVGSEEQKGHEYVRAAAAILRDSALPIDFQGFVEGSDICAGTVDVIVTDGYSGNIAIKTVEGTARMYTSYLRRAMKSSMLSRLGYVLAKQAFSRLRDKLDPRKYNGAVLLGLDSVVVKSHGGTDAFGFANAIGVAVDMMKQDFINVVRHEFEQLSHHLLNPAPASAVAGAV